MCRQAGTQRERERYTERDINRDSETNVHIEIWRKGTEILRGRKTQRHRDIAADRERERER